MTDFQRPLLHALLVSPSYIVYDEALWTFPRWMNAVVLAFRGCLESWMSADCSAFCARSREVYAESSAKVRDTMVCDS